MTRAEKERSERLRYLESWARARYLPEAWPHQEFLKALEEYCLFKWAVSDGMAKNMARIVQLRMTRVAPHPVLLQAAATKEASPEEERGMSALEIIQGYRSANPGEFRPPKTEWKVTEEE